MQQNCTWHNKNKLILFIHLKAHMTVRAEANISICNGINNALPGSKYLVVVLAHAILVDCGDYYIKTQLLSHNTGGPHMET